MSLTELILTDSQAGKTIGWTIFGQRHTRVKQALSPAELLLFVKMLNQILIGTAVAICLATTLATPDVSTMSLSGTLVVPKTVFSSRMRFVFTVGLEGTGHHYVSQVQESFLETNEDMVPIPRPDNVIRAFYTVENSMGENVQHYAANLKGARENMRNFAQRGADLQWPGAVVFMHGKKSYPEGPGQKKVFKYMDLRMLAEVAEEEGVDLRVLYLRRSVKDILIANTMHRQFQK